jgi:hypothetical protein
MTDCVVDSANAIDIGSSSKRFAGVYEITNSAQLDTILNIGYAAEIFIIKPLSGTIVTFDASASTNITLPSGISTFTLDGSSSDFVTMRKIGSTGIITSINTY